MGITSPGCSKFCWTAAVTKMVPVPLCMEAKLKLEVFWKGLWWVCEVWSAELGAFIGWWCTVTLTFPFLITNSWKKSHESLRRAPPGNRTFPFPISESKQCLTDRYALRDPNKLARLVSVNLDRPGNVWELFHAKLSRSWRRRDTNSYGATRVSFKIFISSVGSQRLERLMWPPWAP